MARRLEDDPFTPGFGNLPRVFAGRHAEWADLEVMARRLAAGIYEQPRLVTGDRGVGKTALLREFEDEQRAAGRWVVRAMATRGDAIVGRLTRQLAEVLAANDLAGRLSRRAGAALQRFASLEAGPLGVAVHVQPREPAQVTDGAEQLAALLTDSSLLARERATVLLVLIDEAQNIAPAAIGDLFYAVQEAQTHTVTISDERSGVTRRDTPPLGVVVAGLPGLVSRLKRAGSTFGERSKPVELGVLDDADMREALRAFADAGGARFDADALDSVIAACGGYPYFLHVVGSHVWRAGRGDVISQADAMAGIAAALGYLDAFYSERLRDLGGRQRQYLNAAARLSPADRTVGRIARELGLGSDRLASTWQALVDRHGLLRPAGGPGRVAFALPGLDDYLRRVGD